jgi:hypothetical protein
MISPQVYQRKEVISLVMLMSIDSMHVIIADTLPSSKYGRFLHEHTKA